ncbi:MAG: polysaccharide pyruvyl transferase family protein [Ruminococcaceae bacterium]|nr:polysaccharide pyruvyl transferase family protein [Oscillospiraceae bacterium]
MKKYINVYAYFAQNLGDDLMVDLLVKRFPKFRFYTEREIKNPFLLKNKNFGDAGFYKEKYQKLGKWIDKLLKNPEGSFVEKQIKKIQGNRFCSVLIGGSIFMQRGALSEAQVRACMHRNNSYLNYGPLFAMGANFGAHFTEYFKTSFAEHFKKCAGVSFRDKASYDMFSHLPNINYSPDLVFSLENIPKGRENTGEILVSVIDLSTKYGIEKYAESYENFVSEFCKYIVDIGKTPVLMSFCKAEGDEAAIARIQTKMGEFANGTKTYFYDGDMEKALQRIADCDFVLASRFHAVVLALLFKKRFFALSYDMKIDNMLRDLNSKLYCGIDKLENISPKEIFEKERDISDITDYIKNAKGHFDQLGEYLKNVR